MGRFSPGKVSAGVKELPDLARFHVTLANVMLHSLVAILISHKPRQDAMTCMSANDTNRVCGRTVN
eukprot:scaffold213477_cov43-Prasinocladus_malaysianus.AAC.1